MDSADDGIEQLQRTAAAEHAIAALLEKRAPGKTICPSEAAKHISEENEDWRNQMASVHDAVDRLVKDGAITLSWKGETLGQRRGPYRIARRQPRNSEQ